MRDDHRPKHELIHEITSLRKQVGDLKEAMMARRRVEDALRGSEALLRALTDSAPVGLCLFRHDGSVVTANRRFAQMLGYESPAELQALSGVIGIFAGPEEQSRALEAARAAQPLRAALFRRKDGCQRSHAVLAGLDPEGQAVTFAVFDCIPDHSIPPFRAPSA